ncbi:MAG TPA: hypothetical protein VFZ09_15960 [Archangium sp.]|nr:hypothetical protein [Archangium sp.]HEX5747743.1 hypothetical protein [Archangium sp.]
MNQMLPSGPAICRAALAFAEEDYRLNRRPSPRDTRWLVLLTA